VFFASGNDDEVVKLLCEESEEQRGGKEQEADGDVSGAGLSECRRSGVRLD